MNFLSMIWSPASVLEDSNGGFRAHDRTVLAAGAFRITELLHGAISTGICVFAYTNYFWFTGVNAKKATLAKFPINFYVRSH
jgi:hypothetical protein